MSLFVEDSRPIVACQSGGQNAFGPFHFRIGLNHRIEIAPPRGGRHFHQAGTMPAFENRGDDRRRNTFALLLLPFHFFHPARCRQFGDRGAATDAAAIITCSPDLTRDAGNLKSRGDDRRHSTFAFCLFTFFAFFSPHPLSVAVFPSPIKKATAPLTLPAAPYSPLLRRGVREKGQISALSSFPPGRNSRLPRRRWIPHRVSFPLARAPGELRTKNYQPWFPHRVSVSPTENCCDNRQLRTIKPGSSTTSSPTRAGQELFEVCSSSR